MSQRILSAGIPSLGLLSLAASLSLPVPAMAQQMHMGKPTGMAPEQHQAPPPALPGAQSTPDMVAPADKTVADMLPTDALFDSIHRGDIVAARDALNRGADLDGRNVLGQTPLDLAIDLNRNDITFLLLSMRAPPATDGVPTPQVADGGTAASRATADAGPAPATAPATTHGTTSRHSRTARAHSSSGIVPVAAHAPAGEVRRFASNGGAPNPQAGFLGFDTGH